MVKFIEVDPNDIPNFSESHRGRVSYPILKAFLESGITLAQLDRTGIQQSKQALMTVLGSYCRRRLLPIKVFSRAGEIYLMRTDLDADGKPTLSVADALKGVPEDDVDDGLDQPISNAEIDRRFPTAPGT